MNILLEKIDKLNEYDILIIYSGRLENKNVLSNFIYLTNLNIPELIFTYDFKTKKKIFYYKFKNSKFYDNRSIIDTIEKEYNNIEIFHIDNFNKFIKNYIHKKILTLKENYLHDIKIYNNKYHYNFEYIKLNKILDEERLIKTEDEIYKIKKACNYTTRMFKLLFKKIDKFKYPYQIINYSIYIIKKKKKCDIAYHPICSSGVRNNILHIKNDINKFKENDLILLDIGVKYNNYTSDITRTFPINGFFNIYQTDIYNLVLSINVFAINNSISNVNWIELSNKCFIKIYEGLNKLNIIKEIAINSIKIEIAKLFMPHSLGHSIGLDVHDNEDKIEILKKNMIIAIEPGIYFYEEQYVNNYINKNVLKNYMNIGGIRIEDIIHVLDSDSKNLSEGLKKEIKDIEFYLN